MPLFILGSDLNYDVWTQQMGLLPRQRVVPDVSKLAGSEFYHDGWKLVIWQLYLTAGVIQAYHAVAPEKASKF